MLNFLRKSFNYLVKYRIIRNNNIVFNDKIFIGRNCSLATKEGGKIIFGSNFQMSRYTQFIAWGGNIVIGNNCSINTFSKIVSLEKISIGNNVVIASYVSIIDHNHDWEYIADPIKFRQKYITKPILIGNNVWIGDKVTILKGVNIGSNVVIGANSVVTKDIPEGCIAFGSPAKVIKK